MTSNDGSVGIEVQVPVLGTVRGVRTLKDIASGTAPTSPAEGSAVTVKDPDPRTLATLNSTVAPQAPEKPAAPALAAAPAAAPTAPAAPAPASDPEAEAAKMLQVAENYIRANMKYQAIVKLEEIVKKYPQTEAGKAAKAKLAKLEG